MDAMSETVRGPGAAWQFIRRHFVQIVAGLVLVAAVYGAMLIWMPYQRELRIARKIEAIGGQVEWQYRGSYAVPKWLQDTLPFLASITGITFSEVRESGAPPLSGIPAELLLELRSLNRLEFLYLTNSQTTDADIEHLKELRSLESLVLDNTQVTGAALVHLNGMTNLTSLSLCDTQVRDSGLEHLKGLTNLYFLLLIDTQVTDAGLEHLKGIASLSELNLGETQTTAEGRSMLRKTLPNCHIEPDP